MSLNFALKRIVIPITLMLAVCALYAGCSEVTKYHVLSFFFDGVPPPEGMEPKEVVGPERAEGEPDQASQPRKPEVFFYHAPWQQGQCSECHDVRTSYQVSADGAELCRKCHGVYFRYEKSDWVHGPVALGQCSFCHEAHKSEHRNLLTASETDLCLRCHQASDVLQQPYHKAAEEGPCSRCHDPHLAGNRLLLADSRTYRRRRRTKEIPAHTQWAKADCAKCHIVEKSNQLVDDVDPVCLSCHEQVLEAVPGQEIHAPVRQGQCVLCHTPHRSSRPHLIRPSGEQICYNCHEPGEIRTSSHPPVQRADCLFCHAGHRSEREHLLKPGILVNR